MIPIDSKLYFAYGSNMNDEQMEFRCPDAEAVGTVCLEGYRLAFRSNGTGRGVATILPDETGRVEGVLWKISADDERHLDLYEGYPSLYGKETVEVKGRDGTLLPVMAYTMTERFRGNPARPSTGYLHGILTGCAEHGIEMDSVLDAVREAVRESADRELFQKRPPKMDKNMNDRDLRE